MNDEDKARGTYRRPKATNQAGNVADWGSVDAKKLVGAIATAAKKGGALRFGYTRDGGAYAVGIYAGASYGTEYVRPGEDIDAYLDALKESFDDYAPGDDPVNDRKRSRKV